MSLVHAANNMTFELDHEAILKTLKLNPRDPATQALLLVCERYNLDPVLKHMVLISGNPYVTRDGLLHVAHRSGQLDGIEVIDTGTYETHYWAKVAVYRKDMGRPFTYVGRYPKSKAMAKEFGPEMAVKTAEVAALRRAFSVSGLPAALDSDWAIEPSGDEEPRPALGSPPDAPVEASSIPSTDLASEDAKAELRTRIDALPLNVRVEVAKAWKDNGITALGRPTFSTDDLAAASTMIALAEERVADDSRPFNDEEEDKF